MEQTRDGALTARRTIRVRGTVQGVGFRPTVYRVARAAHLAGFVRNDSTGVLIEIEGAPQAVAGFVEALRRQAPPLSRIDAIEIAESTPLGELEFRVTESVDQSEDAEGPVVSRAKVPADSATCDACVRELFDPSDRRFRYPFVNCTDCGPRFTIIRDLPYDRARTTMDVFAMCAECRAEYEDPGDRRFHAEPVACPACGPRVTLVERGERVAVGDAAMRRAATLLARGAIVALKGLGGYQLAVAASNEAAVCRLRERKRRPHKPFALMARDLSVLEDIVVLDDETRAALSTPARPIVLAPAIAEHDAVAPAVAAGLRELGVMLPTTPLHQLLLADGPSLLVMTSGNLSEEPIAKDDQEAFDKLGAIADAFLVHDRAIHTRADDSVGRIVSGRLQLVRRARGWAPDPLALGFEAPSVLAVGAELKSAVCLTRADEAFVSQHIGDLGSLEARAFFEEVIAKLQRLLGVAPAAVAHDLHPDYGSTRWARASGLPAVAVQHHHAHVASCLVENGASGPAIGIAFDGTGCGPAGDAWGGEILAFDLAGFTRLGHLRPIALPGGEAAIREPWRLAVAALLDAGEPIDAVCGVDDRKRHAIRSMIERDIASPRATGAGRWFDAVAALLGVRASISYEAQAACELEALASRSREPDEPYPFTLDGGPPFEIDLRPTIRAIVCALRRGDPASTIASRFHSTMAEIVLAACHVVRVEHGLDVVALSGGCFQNVILTERTKARLEADGFRVLVHRMVPANDGGIALGQAAIAAWGMRNGVEGRR
ncbi:MAG: [NiFe] hydrogenase metallocenter assembly protein HypF [Myxococcaceae bacterium]|nr:[NiFe] hydrogenase metallocenter assembly protein HypF [Myxococcaceae bacterium]